MMFLSNQRHVGNPGDLIHSRVHRLDQAVEESSRSKPFREARIQFNYNLEYASDDV